MKNLIKNLALFILLAMTFSALTGCGGTATNTTTTSNTVANETKKKSDYPAMPEPVMQAENRGLDGGKIKLADYKGKVVLVNLWATWCGPCREEMPHLVELQNQYKDKGFEVIGLSVEENDTEEMIKDFAQDMKLNYTLGWVEGKTQTEFLKLSKRDGIPQSFLINRDGQLNGVFFSANAKTIAQLKEFVGKAVNE